MKHIIYIAACIIIFTSCKNNSETKPQHKDIIDAVFVSGNIATTNEYKITAFQDGYLKTSFVIEGDSIHAGEILFKLDNNVQQSQVETALANYSYAKKNASDYAPQIAQLKEQINQMNQKMQTDELNLRRYENLIKTNAVSKADYDNVKLIYDNDISTFTQLQQQLANLKQSLAQDVTTSKIAYQMQQQNNAYYNLTSAGNGVVLNIYKHDGDLVKKGETVADIGSGNKTAKLYIDEDDVRKVNLNQQVMIALNTDKNILYEATISKIYPSFDGSAQAFIAEATFIKAPPVLRDNTQLQANIIISKKNNALVIPSTYLQAGNNIKIKKEKVLRHVSTGIATMEWTEITGGLNEHDIIELSKN